MNKNLLVQILLGGGLLFLAVVYGWVNYATASRPAALCIPSPPQAIVKTDGCKHTSHNIVSVVEMGPFDLHRRYLSMQGPGVSRSFRISRLVSSPLIVIPESCVHFIENEKPKQSGRPRRTEGSMKSILTTSTTVSNTTHPPSAKSYTPPTLYWFKGVKIDVLDEQGKVMPSSEFLCHFNLDANRRRHSFFFPSSTVSSGDRMAILSQGTTKIMLPEDFGVPFADQERLRISTQVINRTTNRHRRLKLRVTFYFASDSKQMSALNWGIADLMVLTKEEPGCTIHKSSCETECCMEQSAAENAPNNWINREHRVVKDVQGQVISWHWMVPSGLHTYYSPVTEQRNPGFGRLGPVRAVWLHVHPYCKTVSMVEYLGMRKRILFTAHSTTQEKPALQVMHNDFLVFPQGIALNKNASYRVEAVYDNRSSKPLDAMVIMGMYFSDLKFKRPAWAAI